MLFPSEVLGKTIMHNERTFGRKPEMVPEPENVKPDIFEPQVLPPNITYDNHIVIERETDEREKTESIVIHHTGTAVDRDMSAEEAHLLHKYSFGWAGIGYHYLIRKNGRIEMGRPEHLVGAHASGHNKNSVGVALAGNFNLGEPTTMQMESLISLVNYLAEKYDLDLRARGVVVGHRDVNNTACPGANLYSRLEYVRSLGM